MGNKKERKFKIHNKQMQCVGLVKIVIPTKYKKMFLRQ